MFGPVKPSGSRLDGCASASIEGWRWWNRSRLSRCTLMRKRSPGFFIAPIRSGGRRRAEGARCLRAAQAGLR